MYIYIYIYHIVYTYTTYNVTILCMYSILYMSGNLMEPITYKKVQLAKLDIT